MGDTCSACSTETAGNEIKIQSEKQLAKALNAENVEDLQEVKTKAQCDQIKKSQSKKQVTILTSKTNKSKEYLKLDKGGKKIGKMPDLTNEITQKKIQELGAFLYEHDEFEQQDAEYKEAVEFSCNFSINVEKYIYEGQWLNNERNGRGRQQWTDGSIYEGYWKNNLAHGYGRLIHADGDTYFGQWLGDKANGHGTYISQCGAKYTGEWLNDKQNGRGQEIWPDEAVYIGDYKDGKKHGRGKFVWKDDSSYEGQFDQNNIDGEGVYQWSDGRVFSGHWKNNKMHGVGSFTWPDGRKYEGDYVEDRKEGFGVFHFKDGRVYEGEWLNGKQHGKGLFKKKNISREGVWENGQRAKWLDQEKENSSNMKSSKETNNSKNADMAKKAPIQDSIKEF